MSKPLRHLKVTEVDGVTILYFVDVRIPNDKIAELGEELNRFVGEEKGKRLLIDFTNVEYLGSKGLSELILLDKKLKKNEGQLKFCNMQPELRQVFGITRMDQLFEIHGTEAAALSAFA